MCKEKEWLKRNRGLLLFCLFVLSIIVRGLTAEYIENGGDNTGVWLSLRRLVAGMGYSSWDHHTMRWAVNFPLWLCMKLFGTNPVVYYISPIIYASVGGVLVCLIGDKLHSLKLGLIAAVMYILYPQMTQSGSQMWPGVFEATYVLLCIYLILVWHESKSHSMLVAAVFAFFGAWGARVTSVYFIPGILLLLLLPERDLRNTFRFCFYLGLLIAFEWLWFYWDSGNLGGRIGLIKATHGALSELLVTPHQYVLHFLKFKNLRGLLGVVVLSFVACAYLWRRSSEVVRGLIILYLAHVCLQIWMVSGLNPLKLAQPVGSRYYCVVAPVALLLIILFFINLGDRFPRWRTAGLGIMFVAFLVFSVKKVPASNSLRQVYQDNALVSRAFSFDMPIAMRYLPWEPNLIENWAIETFAGKQRRRELDEYEMNRVMLKNRNRLVALFMGDLDRAIGEKHNVPVKGKGGIFWFDDPAGNTSRTGVVTEFGRKSFRSYRINLENITIE